MDGGCGLLSRWRGGDGGEWMVGGVFEWMVGGVVEWTVEWGV